MKKLADKINSSLSKKILVIEDEPYLRELYVEILSEAGYEIDQAKDGEEGLRKIKENSYDLVLLDIMLPKMDGLEILRKLKGTNPKTPNKAIMLLTNLGQETVISEGVSMGVRGYLIKSDYTPDELIAEVKKAFNNH